MPSVSVDNQAVGGHVKEAVTLYKHFLTGLRGAAAELLAGVSNGTKSLVAMDRDFKRLADDFEHVFVGMVGSALREGSGSAIAASESASSSHATDRSFAVAESLVASFTDSILNTLAAQMRADVRAAEDFVRKQLMAGRSFATSEELVRELEFKFRDKAGREIDSADHVSREINWSYRANYNTTLLFSASALGIEEFVVDGGSNNGTKLSLEDYDKKSGSIFHHNSKALLQVPS